MYKIKVNGISADKIVDSVKKELEYCMNDLVLDMKNDATDKVYTETSKATQRTGQLGDTMKAEHYWRGSVLVGKVSTHVEYDKYVEHGSGEFADEHRGSRTGWYTKHVSSKGKQYTIYHRGQKPKHFMLRTVDEYRPKIKSYFKIKR